MKRRSFFQKLFQSAAIVALAPQLAFRTPVISFLKRPPNISDYECVFVLPPQEITLVSETWTAVFPAPIGKYVVKNFSESQH